MDDKLRTILTEAQRAAEPLQPFLRRLDETGLTSAFDRFAEWQRGQPVWLFDFAATPEVRLTIDLAALPGTQRTPAMP